MEFSTLPPIKLSHSQWGLFFAMSLIYSFNPESPKCFVIDQLLANGVGPNTGKCVARTLLLGMRQY